MTYFVRAFQTEGLDQLLWHWVAIEALVGGESDEPVCSTIHRLKKMLGSAESGQEEIKKQFEKLYRLRCDLVHGNLYFGRVPGTDLYELRELVRRAILKVASLIIPADDVSPLPSRAQLLSVLDSSEAHDDNGEAET
jgi:hypothetical protein